MHYANGEEAKLGDLVVKPSTCSYDTEVIGVLISGNATGSTCNGMIMPLASRVKSDLGDGPWQGCLPIGAGSSWCVTINELLPLRLAAPPKNP